jgi:hypothetical protein
LKCSDLGLTKPFLNKLGLGGINGGDLYAFDQEIPNPGRSLEHMNTLLVYAYDFSKHFIANTPSNFSCPLVFDSGTSSELPLIIISQSKLV